MLTLAEKIEIAKRCCMTAKDYVAEKKSILWQEIWIVIFAHQSKSADEFIEQKFDYVITVCDNAKETCPAFPGKAAGIHQSFEDPSLETVGDYESRRNIFRRVRWNTRMAETFYQSIQRVKILGCIRVLFAEFTDRNMKNFAVVCAAGYDYRITSQSSKILNSERMNSLIPSWPRRRSHKRFVSCSIANSKLKNGQHNRS